MNPQINENVMQNPNNRAGKYLTFSLAGEEYGIGILKIREIVGRMPIVSIPQMPDFVKGVVNLRGKVIPVIDLRLRFGLKGAAATQRTCIIVIEIGRHGTAAALLVGLMVDSVSEVLNIRSEDIEDTPALGARVETQFLLGMAKSDGRVKLLLDIDYVLDLNEINTVSKAA